jgi:hypothetical protein
MARGRKQTPEQSVNILRQIEVAMANRSQYELNARHVFPDLHNKRMERRYLDDYRH